MENAVQALKTAAAVLIFIIAITTTFVMFSKAKITADTIITSQDKQKYLESAKVDNGVLYTSSDAIQQENESGESAINGMTVDGYRIVAIDDVISTLYRYSIEKYGVTIVKQNGDVLSRFDSNTENIVRQYYSLKPNEISKFEEKMKENTTVTINRNIKVEPNINLKEIYSINVNGNSNIKCGAPWYGNDVEITNRINCQLSGKEYELNGQQFNSARNNLRNELIGKKIIEVVNSIDTSKYLKEEDGETNTSLITDYQLPTIEIVYVIK